MISKEEKDLLALARAVGVYQSSSRFGRLDDAVSAACVMLIFLLTPVVISALQAQP